MGTKQSEIVYFQKDKIDFNIAFLYRIRDNKGHYIFKMTRANQT